MSADRQLDKLVETAARDLSILAVLLFGSRARGENHEGSDIDVCLVLESEASTELFLSEKKHEYLSQFDLDIQVFQQLPLFMRQRVLRDGRVLYARDEDPLYERAFRTAQHYEDFRYRHESYLEEVASG